jgi:hypothetical protein
LSVEAALQAILTADATLTGLTTGGIWQSSPPQSQARPYLVWQKVAPIDTAYTLRLKVSDADVYQLVAWAEDTDTTAGVDTARAIIDRAETVLFDAALNVSGRTTLHCRKVRNMPDLEDAESGGEAAYGKGIELLIEVS